MGKKRAFEESESQVEPGGNTGTPGQKRTKQAIQCWKYCFTLSVEHESQKIQVMELWHLLHEHCKKFTFQLEKGEGGYLHYQGQVSLYEKRRIGELKNLWGLNWVHLEPTKNIFAAVKYTTKDDTRVEGPWSESKMPLKPVLDVYFPWQEAMLAEFREVADRRKVIWYFDPVGKHGKSTFAVHLSRLNEGYLRIPGRMKRRDMNHLFMSEMHRTKVVIFDIERDDFYGFDYAVLAELKNGQIVSGKYKGGRIDYDAPHVVVFANHSPNVKAMSIDRWDIRTL